MRHLRSVPAMRPPGSPRRRGSWQARIHEPRGSAPRERDHRGGDHPVPSRTRQLSPPSPRVLQREAAGGQGVALAEGAFLYAPREARGGTAPCGPFAFWERLRPHERRCARRLATGTGAPRGGLRPLAVPSPRPRDVAGRRAGGRAPRGRRAALPRWRSAAWQAARISRRRTRRVISLACLFAFGAQGDPRGDVLRGRPRRTSPYRMRRGARTRSLVRALSALSRWVRCIGPITLRVLKRPCRPYTEFCMVLHAV